MAENVHDKVESATRKLLPEKNPPAASSEQQQRSEHEGRPVPSEVPQGAEREDTIATNVAQDIEKYFSESETAIMLRAMKKECKDSYMQQVGNRTFYFSKKSIGVTGEKITNEKLFAEIAKYLNNEQLQVIQAAMNNGKLYYVSQQQTQQIAIIAQQYAEPFIAHLKVALRTWQKGLIFMGKYILFVWLFLFSLLKT